MRTIFYRQCLLTSGETSDRVWIPEAFAIGGNLIRIGEALQLWTVAEVGENRREGRSLSDHERDYLGHRSRTDV